MTRGTPELERVGRAWVGVPHFVEHRGDDHAIGFECLSLFTETGFDPGLGDF